MIKTCKRKRFKWSLTDCNKKIKMITGVAPFDDILFMDDDFDDNSLRMLPLRIVLL